MKKYKVFAVLSLMLAAAIFSGCKTDVSAGSLSEDAAPLAITLSQEIKDKTNQDVKVSVKAESNSGIKKIAWRVYDKNETDLIEYSLAGTDITSEKSFTVSKNGTYIVGVEDNLYRQRYKVIDITNIDKTAPGKVKGLYAIYNYALKKIIVNWTEPSDTDFAKVEITYGISGGTQKTVEKEKGTTTLELTDIEATNETYDFSVKSIDDVGNKTAAENISVETKITPRITSVQLDRTHVSFYDSDQTVNVKVYGSNFDRISQQTDTTFLVQVEDSTGNITNFNPNIDISSNSATATVTLPQTASATTNGTNYTIKVNLCGTTDTEHAVTVNVSSDWNVSSITLDVTQIAVTDVTTDSKVHVIVNGTNLDLAKNAVIKLFDSTGVEYTQSTTSVTVPTELHAKKIEADVKIPEVDDTYTVKIISGSTIGSKTKTIQVYGVPQFTSFRIPPAGTSKQNSNVTATVIGKNFKAPGVTDSNFNVNCATTSITNNSTVTVVNDSRLLVTLTIPKDAGSYDVTITNGENSKQNSFVVKDYGTTAIGDIIYDDGTTSSKDDTLVAEKTPVAVVASFDNNGAMLGLGLKQFNNTQWAPKETTGYNTIFTNIVATSNKTGTGITDAYITGDLDGSDNWQEICLVDPEGTQNAQTNYPAFYEALMYGTNQNLPENIKDGWFIPSIKELHTLYLNLTVLNTSLTKCSGTKISTSYDPYCSSSQYSSKTNTIWKLYFYSTGSIYGNIAEKDSKYYVRFLRLF